MAKLVFRAEGTVNGFGDVGSTTNYRFCAKMPTKRSWVGLLSAACGYKRNDPRIKELSDKISINVTNESEDELLVDYQTVNGGRSVLYNKNGKKIEKGILMANGSGNNYHAIEIRKEYRCGKLSYLVEVESDDETIEMLKYAIRNPCYFLYLGKKCCPAKVYLLEDVKCR